MKCVFNYLGVITKKGVINQNKATAQLLLLAPDELHPLAHTALEKCFKVREYDVRFPFPYMNLVYFQKMTTMNSVIRFGTSRNVLDMLIVDSTDHLRNKAN